MGIQQDFVLRMIEQLAEAFGRIFDGEEVDDESRAIVDIERALAEVFRTQRELLFMNVDGMIGQFDSRLAAEVGRMFLKHSHLCASQGRPEAADRSYALAIECLQGGLGEELCHTDKTSNDLMRQLLRADQTLAVLDAEQMSQTWRDIFEIEARRQRYTSAEDALFHAIDLAAEPGDHLRRGIRFYEALSGLDDEVLDDADLPRVEVEEALAELRERSD